MAHINLPFVGNLVQAAGQSDFVMPADKNLDGHASFAASLANADTVYYLATSIANKNEWEFGLGTWTASTRTLARTTVKRGSNGTTKVSFTAGGVEVVMARAGDLVHLEDYTVTNLTPTRSISGTESTAANIAAVVATLVNDLITAGVLK